MTISRNKTLMLVTALVRGSLGVPHPPGRNLSLVQLVHLPVGTSLGLRIEEVEQGGHGNQHSAPDVDGLDTHIGGIGADHVRNGPLEDDAEEEKKC